MHQEGLDEAQGPPPPGGHRRRRTEPASTPPVPAGRPAAACRRSVRPPADAVRARARRRRARPPQDQVRRAGLREDRGEGGASASSGASSSAVTCTAPICSSAITPSSMRSGRRPTGSSESRARTCRVGGRHEFVGWYNGHPDHPDREFDLNCERVVVVGNGNVAIDCARMLALSAEELRGPTRPTTRSRRFAPSRQGDRDPRPPRAGAGGVHQPRAAGAGRARARRRDRRPRGPGARRGSQAWLDSDEADKTSRENVRILREYAPREPAGKPKRIVLRFLTSPVELQGEERVERIVVERNRLEPRDDGRWRAADRRSRDARLRPRAALDRLQGHRDSGGALRRAPRHDPERRRAFIDGEHHVTGEYVTGWIRRGPSGVIGTNKKDGQEAASSLLEDAAAGLLNEPGNDGDIARLLAERGVEPVSWEGWERIDAHERAAGEPTGRPRVELRRVGRSARGRQGLRLTGGSGAAARGPQGRGGRLELVVAVEEPRSHGDGGRAGRPRASASAVQAGAQVVLDRLVAECGVSSSPGRPTHRAMAAGSAASSRPAPALNARRKAARANASPAPSRSAHTAARIGASVCGGHGSGQLTGPRP